MLPAFFNSECFVRLRILEPSTRVEGGGGAPSNLERHWLGHDNDNECVLCVPKGCCPAMSSEFPCRVRTCLAATLAQATHCSGYVTFKGSHFFQETVHEPRPLKSCRGGHTPLTASAQCVGECRYTLVVYRSHNNAQWCAYGAIRQPPTTTGTCSDPITISEID
jgi:hypothetical protein